ncbi:PQQ-binding-like beta-propeller repeat protein [Ulvibacterium sp.]|uniref:outer membrane protein assembly factor BamB family protein n=1 Tax=Ulvibacterium sp. TaxID=2665914 RepID=UPI003BAD477C
MRKIIQLLFTLAIFHTAFAQWHNDYLSHHAYESKALKKEPREKWIFNAEGRVFGPALKEGNSLFFGDTKGFLYSIDSENGQLNWKFKAEAKVLSCPTINSRYAYFGSYDGYLYCLDIGDGELVWKFKTGSGASCSPPLVKDNKVFFGSHDGYYYVVNKMTGGQLLKKEIGEGTCSTTSYDSGLLYLGDWGGNVHCLHADDLKSEWSFKTDYKIYQTPTLVEKQVIMASFDSIVYSLDKKTGALKWKKKLNSVANQVGFKNNVTFFNTRDSDLYALDKENGKLLWRFETDGSTWGFAINAEDTIYFGSGDNKLYAIDLYTGKKIWEYEVGDAVQRGSIYDRILYFPSGNKLYALH